MHRRKFIKTAGQTLTGLFGLSALKKSSSLFDAVMAASAPRAIEPRDEAFWAMVREQFPLTHERIYLNTGGLGASPYVVIEAVKNKITELERICETGHSEELWHDIKSKAGQILGCKPEELAYMRNATEGIAIVCNGLPLKRGDEVITTGHTAVGTVAAVELVGAVPV
ncbi:hypothetical protein FBQ85_26440, partial [Cytophagia bacterium CHB2]|nr:hypothetical protein [Cytophagia bacterium CHB2]